MSNLVLNCEQLNRILDGKKISLQDAFEIFNVSENEPTELFQTAQILRKQNKGNFVSFSKKAFFNLVNLCKDTCSYCTYKAEPDESKLSMLSKDDVIQLLTLAKKYNCVEALFVTGESPEQKYQEARTWLKENGFSSTAEYLVHVSEQALLMGLFPHTNAGNLTKEQMRELQKTNPSMARTKISRSKNVVKRKWLFKHCRISCSCIRASLVNGPFPSYKCR